MAVLIEGISVVINDKDLSGADFKDWNDFLFLDQPKDCFP